VEAMKARLFARLRGHFQRRDRLRLVIGYRRKDLESLERLEKELTLLESEAEELAKEIEELTGEAAPSIG
jgi:predicted  nucleic acid-binding Zn-ribbon protein